MKRENSKYLYRITWSDEDAEYVGLCAEFPSLSWLSRTPEGALKGISKLVAEVVADLTDKQESVPEPLAVRRYSGKFMVRIPPEVHRTLTQQAAEQGVSINRFVSAKLSR